MNYATKNFGVFALALFAVVIGAALSNLVPHARAQFSPGGTWIPSSAVGGTANAVTLSIPSISQMGDLLGIPIRFEPASTNVAGGTTIAVVPNSGNVLTAYNVERSSAGLLVPIAGGDFTAGSTAPFAEVIWDGAEFVQKNPATGDAPVGTEIVLTGPTAPAGYLIENGTCISETTYSALYAYYGSSDIWSPGSTDGACSSGEFHLKFANGRASVASNTQGSQTGPLTNCAAGVGQICGAQTQTIAQNQLPNVSPTISGSQNVTFVNCVGQAGGCPTEFSTTGGGGTALDYGTGSTTIQGSNFSASSINGNVTQQELATVPPNNQNIFAVKY